MKTTTPNKQLWCPVGLYARRKFSGNWVPFWSVESETQVTDEIVAHKVSF
jgi:hypothetical protein